MSRKPRIWTQGRLFIRFVSERLGDAFRQAEPHETFDARLEQVLITGNHLHQLAHGRGLFEQGEEEYLGLAQAKTIQIDLAGEATDQHGEFSCHRS